MTLRIVCFLSKWVLLLNWHFGVKDVILLLSCWFVVKEMFSVDEDIRLVLYMYCLVNGLGRMVGGI